MNTYHNIQALLDKYWEGETSLDEERQLKSYFNSGTIDERLQQFAPMFRAFREEQAIQLNKAKVVDIRPASYQYTQLAVAASVAILLAAGIWWLFSAPKPSMEIVETPQVEVKKDSNLASKPPEQEVIVQAEPAPSMPAAPRKRSLKKLNKPVPIDPEAELAMEEIKAALALVSSKIKKGRSEAAKGASRLEEVDRIFKKKAG